MSPPLRPIAKPYLLILFGVPSTVDDNGRRHLDRLWAKDLVEHVRYIERLTLAAPALRGPAPSGSVPVDELPPLARLEWIDLPPVASHLEALRQLPRTWRILWRACGRAALVHSAVAGWPFPEAWVLRPIVWLRRPLHYINVESAFWRLVPGESASLKRRLRARLVERLNRSCIEAADLSTFTHDGYRRDLLQRHPERGHVVEASWIDADMIVDDEALAAVAVQRRADKPLRLVFAGRLTASKGAQLLLQAVSGLIGAGHDLELDLFGDGPLKAEFEAVLRDAPVVAARVRLRGAVPYDMDFFGALRRYHLLVVPTLSDEQPRIVFDAYSQGLPVLASDTAGIRGCIEAGVTGALFRSGDVQALADAIVSAVDDRKHLIDMATACVDRARAFTHQQMHRTRWALLARTFPELLET